MQHTNKKKKQSIKKMRNKFIELMYCEKLSQETEDIDMDPSNQVSNVDDREWIKKNLIKISLKYPIPNANKPWGDFFQQQQKKYPFYQKSDISKEVRDEYGSIFNQIMDDINKHKYKISDFEPKDPSNNKRQLTKMTNTYDIPPRKKQKITIYITDIPAKHWLRISFKHNFVDEWIRNKYSQFRWNYTQPKGYMYRSVLTQNVCNFKYPQCGNVGMCVLNV